MTFTIPRPDWVSDALVEERGEHAGFQMYSREGNDAVAEMIHDVTRQGEERMLLRGGVIDLLQEGIRTVATNHPEIHDTEPEWAVVDAMNVWFSTNGFRGIGRDDLL